ncbi:MAG: methyltransferase domain-containing protein [Chthoniobacter sp.]|uniref:class I SAM-dependent methyltransferase n=1 Tax=Chthoniobacter sp. TaxID=2510640 RepID=UPI0032A5DB2A
MNRDGTLIDYYSQRASEYERIYHQPERQADLVRLKDHLRGELSGRRILELACGTGYWTAALADAAESIYAIDASDEVLAIARAKGLDPNTVSFTRGDAFAPPRDSSEFTAGFAGFWWSHIPLDRLTSFLENFHAALLPGARVVFIDNRYVPGSSTPISRTDEAGNTYQQRHLDDGTAHEVLKNFPTTDQLRPILQPYTDSLNIVEFDYFWCATYALAAASHHQANP